VTSSVTILQALLWQKLSVYDQIVIYNLKSNRDGYQTTVYVNFHPKMIYE